MTDPLRSIYDLIADDAYAASFQSIGQYRTNVLGVVRDRMSADNEPSLDDRMHALAHDLMNAGRLEEAARLAQPPRDE